MIAIETTYHGPTNTRGSRISATADGGRPRVSIPYPHELNSREAHIKAARKFLEKMGWYGELVTGSTKAGYVHVFVKSYYYNPTTGAKSEHAQADTFWTAEKEA